MQLALSSVLCCPLCLFSPVPSLLSFPRAGCMPAPWHLCLTSGEQEKVEAFCPPSSHLKLVLFLLLSDKVLEQNIAALCICGQMDTRRGMSEEHSCVVGAELQVPGKWTTWGNCSFALQLLSSVKAPGPSLRTSERLAQEVSEGKDQPFSSP